MHDILEAKAADMRKTAEASAAGDFTDFDLRAPNSPDGDFPTLADFPEDMQFRIAVVGNMIDKIAQDGDTLLCVRAGVDGAEPQDGDLVVIELGDSEDSRISIRRLRRIGDRCEFRHESNDPAFQAAPLSCDMRQDDGGIRVLGKALFAYRRLGA